MTNGSDSIYAAPCEVNGKEIVYGNAGLTKREYFAAMAMQGMLAQDDLTFGRTIPIGEFEGWKDYQLVVRQAVESADALIEALNKEVA